VTELRIDLRDDPEAAFETALQAGRIQAPLETVIEQIEAARESGNAGEFYKVLDGYAIHGRTADLGGRLQGFEQDDVLSGGQGRDEIHGAGGDDALDGGVGADALFGGAGDDILVGGQGGDVLSGGAGADVFVFDGGHGPDVIVDFDLLEDRLDFTGLVESADDLHLQVRHGDTIIKGAEAPIVLEDVELHVQDIEDALIF
jgi:Ca2+-binding RTX toxin-like protein